jgi:DNA mismatch repair protein MutS2
MVTRKLLELLEWPVIEEKISSFCSTGPGRALVSFIAPLDEDGARRRLRLVSEMKDSFLESPRPDFSGIIDLTPHLALAGKGGVLTKEQVIEIKEFLEASSRVRRHLNEISSARPELSEELQKFLDTKSLDLLLSEAITAGGEFSEKKFPRLKEIADETRALRAEIEKTINSIIYNPSLEKAIQEKIHTTRGDRYVVLVKVSMKGRIRGNIQDISASGQTLYVEPEQVIPLNNRLILVQAELASQIIKILRILSAEISKYGEEITANLKLLAGLDMITALADFSLLIRASEPEISPDPVIRLFSARHPILDMMNPEGNVPNDFDLGYTYSCVVITGANTGGKTVLLKTVGLCVYMTSCGMHIPAGPDSKCGIFTSVLADIGDDQNIAMSLSSFSGQLMEINEMLNRADSRTLILIDELMAGTNPAQGALLAAAILKHLADRQARVIVTTHYPSLQELQAADSRFINASVDFDLTTLRPLYTLRTGLPGSSHAFEIAESYGLPAAVIDDARAMMDSTSAGAEFLLDRVKIKERELEEFKRELDEYSSRIRRRENGLEDKEREIEKKRALINKTEGNRFLHELSVMRETLNSKIRDSAPGSGSGISSLKKEIEAAADSAAEKIKEFDLSIKQDDYQTAVPDNVIPGCRVYIIPLEKEGRVAEVQPDRLRADILFGNGIKSTFRFSDLLVSRAGHGSSEKKNSPPVKRREGPAGDRVHLTMQTSYNTVDLRGKRVDEGLSIMESGLDRMVRAGIDSAVIIHGFGTGAMKEAVRSYLGSSFYCEDFRPGEQGEGGDGVTVVSLTRI